MFSYELWGVLVMRAPIIYFLYFVEHVQLAASGKGYTKTNN